MYNKRDIQIPEGVELVWIIEPEYFPLQDILQ